MSAPVVPVPPLDPAADALLSAVNRAVDRTSLEIDRLARRLVAGVLVVWLALVVVALALGVGWSILPAVVPMVATGVGYAVLRMIRRHRYSGAAR